ncbi:MAG: amylo-alpha-1,6-glucosidase [Chloroflexota bacterium]|nr:amylo-alpha-1,6-glucosidase [Chloroflexota bacterium]
MPVEISVGPPTLTINQGSTFMVTDLNGEITTESEQGVFAGDTRFVGHWSISANDRPWVRLTSSPTAYYAARIHLTNQAFATEDGEVPAGTLMLTIGRAVREGIHEDLDLTNHGLRPARFNLEIVLRSDFADIFEVRAHAFVRRGRIVTRWREAARELETTYARRDFRRRFAYRLQNSGSPGRYANGRITFEIDLAPGATWHSCCYYVLTQGERVSAPERDCQHEAEETALDWLQHQWQDEATGLTSGNEDVYRLYRQSIEDLGALRLPDHDFALDVWLPAAGVPWFVTIFGRDSLIVSLQSMWVHTGLALGALKKLAELQPDEMDDWRDAEPGKIPHEIRFGELAHFKTVPHTPYYGTADATALYLIALHEAWKWLGEDTILREYHDVAERCLNWIDRHGDLDGDGFQEFRTRSPKGYENMGWKDRWDAVVYPDGSQVRPPKALCELQGYAFDAWMRMAEVFDALGEPSRAAELRRKAAELRARFKERFWCEDIGFYAHALDPDRWPVRTVTSNAGHCLWSGIASPEHAARVIQRLLKPDMWSGWGIRTLSTRNPAYNPISYHRGSVWPHDNGIIALGFRRYGFAAEAARIARDICEAARYFVSYCLPKLYAGLERRPGTFPVQYLGANVPQAWAAGTVFHLLQALLGLQADAPNGRLFVDPELPAWLPDVTLRGVTVGKAMLGDLTAAKATLDLRFWREGERTRWEILAQEGEGTVEQKPWRPWVLEGRPG